MYILVQNTVLYVLVQNFTEIIINNEEHRNKYIVKLELTLQKKKIEKRMFSSFLVIALEYAYIVFCNFCLPRENLEKTTVYSQAKQEIKVLVAHVNTYKFVQKMHFHYLKNPTFLRHKGNRAI